MAGLFRLIKFIRLIEFIRFTQVSQVEMAISQKSNNNHEQK